MKTCRWVGAKGGRIRAAVAVVGLLAAIRVTPALAHNLTGDPFRPHYDWSVRPPETVTSLSTSSGWAVWRVAQTDTARPPARATETLRRTDLPTQVAAFEAFGSQVRLRWDANFIYVESNGLPAHQMMIGITAWQQQVPLPQPYTGDNAWRLPLRPVPAEKPVLIKGRFLRGAIAIAANGIPIFNPQNNRGELAQEIGELDQWGGHCGRADDYHYHATPFHLQGAVGPRQPLAFALDGYPIYGLTEPGGEATGKLDVCNGHETPALGYHYHGSTKYPYVQGGFHGVVIERDGQVDPQPRAQSVRPAGEPLRGARITGFEASADAKTFALQYVVNGRPAAVNYATTGDGVWTFSYRDPNGATREETHRAGARGGGEAGKGAKSGKAGKAGKARDPK